MTGPVLAAVPVVDFSGSPLTGKAPLDVYFTDASTETPVGWAWYFGDENYSVPWAAVNSGAGWPGRGYHSSLAMPDNSIVLIGGYPAVNETWRSTDNGGTWTNLTANPGWMGRRAHSSVLMPDGSIVLTGGWNGTIQFNDTWLSSDNGVSWTLQSSDPPWSARRGHSSVVMPDGSIVLMGGFDGTIYKNDTWRSTDNGTTWTQMTATAGWQGRSYHASLVVPGGSILLMGGYSGSTARYNDVWRSMDNGATWSAVNAGSGWTARYGHSSVLMPDHSIILLGGYDGIYRNDTWRSGDYGATWTQLTANAGWTRRASQSCVIVPDGSIVLTGGYDNNYIYKNDVWRFQPTGSSAQNPSHTYTRAGTYNVTLQAFNADGYSGTQKTGYISVTEPPASRFTGTPTIGIVPLTVQFNDTSMNTPTSWNWSFGDGNTSTLQNPIHTYAFNGTFTVTLNATNAYGSNISVRTDYIVVSGPRPVPDFSANVTSGNLPLPVLFTDLSSNNPTGWAWFFGDENWAAPWTQQTADAGWSARNYHSSISMPDGSIVLTGGKGSTGLKGDVWISKDNGVSWALMTENPGWSARYRHATVPMPDGSIVLMGGYDGTYKNDTWRSMDNGATWTLVNGSSRWPGRAYYSSVVLPDGSIVLMGGAPVTNDTWRSTDSGASWTLMNASSGWSARFGHTSVVLPDGSIVLMGGHDGLNRNDTWRSTDSGASWSLMNASSGWSARNSYTSVALPDGSIVLMGGVDTITGNKNDVWRSADNGASWTELTDSAWPSPRGAPSSVVMPDGSIVRLGGSDNSGYKNDVCRFQPVGSTLPNPSHTYTVQGTYNVTLQAYRADGYNSTRKIGYIRVTAPPKANFIATPAIGNVPLIVQFNDTSANTPTSWNWSFGDGNTSTLQNPVHTYVFNGTFTVTLNATSDYGSNISVRTDCIVVKGPKPVADFSANVTSGNASLPVSFTDSSLNSPTGWAWFFGDETYTAPWTQQNASAGWSGRYKPCSVVMPDGSIVLMGGYDNYPPTGVKNDVWRSTDSGATWTLLNGSAGWSARFGHTAVVMPDWSIVLMGGFNSYSNTLNQDVWRSTDLGYTWTLVNASPGWSARRDHSSVVLPDGTIVLMGGSDGSFRNDVWQSADGGSSWTQVTTTGPIWSGRVKHTTVVLPDSTIILMGGSDGPSRNDVWRSDDGGITWSQVAEFSWWTPRFDHNSVVIPDGSIVLMGGYDHSANLINDVWRSADNGTTWIQVNQSAGWKPRYGPTSVAMPDGSIVLMGGYVNTGYGILTGNDVWRFQPTGSLAQNPLHTFAQGGTYNVTLQAFNTGGYNSTRKSGFITVSSESGVSNVYPRTVTNTSAVYFTISGDNFTSPMGVELRKENVPVAWAKWVWVSSISSLIATFDLRSVPEDTYDLAVLWADGTEKVRPAAVSVSTLPEGSLFVNTNMTLGAGHTVQYNFTVSSATSDLFTTLHKVSYEGDVHQNWYGTVTLLCEGVVIKTDSSNQDQLLHVKNPVPGNYTLTISAAQHGTGMVDVSTSLPVFPDGNWVIAPIYRPYGSTYHQITIPPGKSILAFTAEAMGEWSHFRVYHGQWGSYQQWISSQGPDASLSIPNPEPGLYIVEFMDTQMISDEHQEREVMLKVSTTGQVSQPPAYLPALSSYTPSQGGNTGRVTLQIRGAWLEPNATVTLAHGGGPVITAYSVSGNAGKSLLEASFNLSGKTPGQYILNVTNPDGLTVTSSVPFTIEQGGRSEFWTEITGREKIRVRRPATYLITYGNKGNLDMAAPVLSLAADPPSETITARCLPSGDWHPMNGAMVLVTKGPDNNQKILPAGYSSTIEVEVLTDESVGDFDLVLTPYGGDRVYSPCTLERSIDAFAPAPGTPLTFERSFPGHYSSYIGSFGYGWVHTYDMHLEDVTNGTIGLMKGDTVVSLLTRSGDQVYSADGEYAELKRNPDSSSLLTMQDGSTIGFGTNQKPVSCTDTNGNEVTFSYSGGQLTGIRHSDGDEFILTYGPNNRITSIGDHAGKVTTYSYDPESVLLTSVTRPDGTVTTYSYDASSGAYALGTIAYPGGITRNYRIDGDGRLAETSLNSNKEAVSFSYDEGNQTTTVKDTAGSAIHARVNEKKQVVETENAAGATQEFTYDQNSDLVRATDPLGNSYQMVYDSEHALKEVTNPLGNTIAIGYDNQHTHRTSLTDQRGNAFNFTYDSKGNMVGITYPGSRTESEAYDSHGNLIRTTTRKGEVINFQYNARGQKTRTDYPDGSHTDFSYDSAGNLVTATNANGTVTLEYNARNQPKKVLFPDGNTFAYTYNDAGLVSSRTGKDGYSEAYTYDDQGNLVQVSDGNLSVLARYTYNSAGKLQRKEVRNGGYTTYAYDTVGQVSRLVNCNSSGAVLSSFDYQYDAAGNPVSIGTPEGTNLYTYDAIGQLVTVVYPGGNMTRYSYDAAGNRVSVIDGSGTTLYTTNEMNQYTQAGSATFTYDANGNLIEKSEFGNITTYEYNYDNRLIRVTSPEGVSVYTYDALGNRASITWNGNLTRYSVDPLGIGDVVAEYSGDGSLVARYTHGLGLLSKIDPLGNEYSYSFDQSGHTVGITDSSGKAVNQYRYTPFGEYRQKYETIRNPFTYVGEYGVMDDGNGLLYMRMRHYSSNLGRFVSEDKLDFREYDYHAYQYCQNSPVLNIDPIGMSPGSTGAIMGSLRAIGGGIALVGALASPVGWLSGIALVSGAWNFVAGTTEAVSGVMGFCDPLPDSGLFEAIGNKIGGKTGKQLGWIADAIPGLITSLYNEPVKWLTTLTVPPVSQSIKIPSLFKKALETNLYLQGEEPGPSETPDPCKCEEKPKPPVNIKRQPVLPRDSIDPEDKYGPAGYDAPGTPPGSRHHFINRDTRLAYRVDFWNAENASAYVRDVDAYDEMDSDLEWDSFRFTGVGFTDWKVPLDPCQYFKVYVDTRPSMDYIVQIEGIYDPATGIANLTYNTLDPVTLAPPDDPVAGFLPPITSSWKEIGWFAYTVDPKHGVSSGTVIENQAWVNFDYSKFMPAPKDAPWVNIIDTGAPSTSVAGSLSGLNEIRFTLSGSDDLGGSGIKDYTVYGSDNGGPYTPYINHVTNTSASFIGVQDHTYRFFSVGRDGVGNIEATKSIPEATVYIPAPVSPPNARFTVTPNKGPAPLTVDFTDLSENSPTEWRWNFGDGNWFNTTDSSRRNTNHTYSSSGTYTAQLTVSGAGGSSTSTGTTITVTASAPVASFATNTTSGPSPLTVMFSDTSAGETITAWNWSFGDTTWSNITNSTLRNVTHTYPNPGMYTARLTIANAGGSNTTSAGTNLTVLSTTAPNVTGIIPATGVSGAKVSVTNISGYNFKSTTKVNLTRSGCPNIPATNVKNTSSTKITCSFNLAGAPAGLWNVVVTNPDGQTGILPNGFNITSKNPSFSSITPNSGYKNSTTSFKLTGSNFQAGVIVNFTNGASTPVNATITAPVSSTTILGTISLPADVPSGKWNITLTNPDGKAVKKIGGFTVNPWPMPSVSAIMPSSGSPNTTVPFSVSGSGFEKGSVIYITNSTYPAGNLTVKIDFISMKKMTGNLTIPSDAPVGKWNVMAFSPDGGMSKPKVGLFVVKPWPKPAISSLQPTTAIHGTTVLYTLSGSNFQPGSTVILTNASALGLNFTANVNTLSQMKITGAFDVPGSAIGKYGIEVHCPDGKIASKGNALTVK